MNVKYDPADLVQVYFEALKYSRTILVYLQEMFVYKVITIKGIDHFNKHMELNKTVDDWGKNRISENMEDI